MQEDRGREEAQEAHARGAAERRAAHAHAPHAARCQRYVEVLFLNWLQAFDRAGICLQK